MMPQVGEECRHILLEGLLVVLESGTMLSDLTGVGYLEFLTLLLHQQTREKST